MCWHLILLASLTGTGQPPSTAPVPSYPDGKLGEVVRLGEAIVRTTKDHPLSKPYVGNALECTSCHLDAGRHPKAASFVGVATAYPAFSPREQRVITLEDRVLNCFMRSCNGTRPPLGSDVSVAITAYITWLSREQPLRMNAQAPLGPNHVPRLTIDFSKASLANGRDLYESRCASCHGGQGQGTREGPPVWGDRSYTAGAGLAQIEGLASWLKVAKLIDDRELTDDEARDLASFLVAQPRPAFDLRSHLPPPEGLGRYNSAVLDEVQTTPPGK